MLNQALGLEVLQPIVLIHVKQILQLINGQQLTDQIRHQTIQARPEQLFGQVI